MHRFRSLISRHLVIDAGVALVLAGVALAEVLGQDRAGAGRAALALSALAGTLPLAIRRRHPLASVLAISAAIGVQAALAETPDSQWIGVVVIIASYSVAVHAPLRDAIAGLAAAVMALITAFLTEPSNSWGEIVFGLLLFVAAPWLGGLALRGRAVRAEELRARIDLLEREQEARAHEAVTFERMRIARELHDVVAHSVSVIAIQTDVADAALDHNPESARPALRTVKETARTALNEMRRLLGVLRETDHTVLSSQPGLADLPALAEQARRAGLPTELEVEGSERRVSSAVDLSAYRIVQESLTNTLKHAGPARARVRLRCGPDALELEVQDDGRGGTESDGTGHGLVGMRERVALLGGELSVGPRPEGGYRVSAVLPLR